MREKLKVLVYTRPRINVFFKELAANVPVFSEIHYFSDHSGTENIDLMARYYNVKSKFENGEFNTHHIWDKINFQDIGRRCRYLRTLIPQERLIRIKCMSIALLDMIEEYSPDYIFGMVMDSYILDLCDRLMRIRKSQYIGFLNNMLNGYSRITSRGELIFNNTPSEELVGEKINELRERYYIPNMQKDFMWNTKPFSMFFTKYLKEKIKIGYYYIKRFSDPDNFYYNTVASDSCMSCRSLSQILFRRHQNNNYTRFIAEAKEKGKIIVYLPLQFYPECSIDYWGTSKDFSDFYSTVDELLKLNLSDIVILTKEHPSAYGLRKDRFYKDISKNNSFCLVPFDISSNDIINQADLILTWTGSVGVEAIIRDKPLITFGNAYYSVDGICSEVNGFDDLSSLNDLVCATVKNYHRSEGQIKNFVKNLLSGLVEGYVFPLDYGTKKNPYNHIRMKKLGENVSSLLKRMHSDGCYPVRSGTYD